MPVMDVYVEFHTTQYNRCRGYEAAEARLEGFYKFWSICYYYLVYSFCNSLAIVLN